MARRILILAPVLSLFAGMSSFQDQDSEGTVHVVNSNSIIHELAGCNPNDSTTKEYCARLKEVEAEIDLCLADCYKTITSGLPAPTPCPSGQCEPFYDVPRVSFFSEKDMRRVEILVNNKLIGTAKDVSYDAKTKQRTVVFDVKKSFKNTKGVDQNVMMARFPVTYRVAGKDVKSMFVVKLRF